MPYRLTHTPDSLMRSVAASAPHAWLRTPISILVSLFLLVFVGTLEWALWLAIILTLEATAFWTRAGVLGHRRQVRPIHIAVIFSISLCWVVHAVLLWGVGGEIPRIAAMMDLFSVALYAAIGTHYHKRLMLALLTPPLIALAWLIISYLYVNASPFTATFASLATIGSCITILANGLSMHATDRDLAAANEALAEMAKAANAANAAKDGFMANMSHEIRTPLNGVVGMAAALGATGLDERQREMVALIHDSAEALEHLLSDLLDLSKIESGKIELVTEPFDLRSSIEPAAHLFRVRAEEKGVAFKIVYGPAARGWFIGDAFRIRQIVSNLVSNAVKFTHAGAITLRVEIEDSAEDLSAADLRIELQDTGVGFDQETGKRLFHRFEQADGSITRRFGGTGLGLSICKALTDLMQGDITARSTPGQGSTFIVTLPLRRTMSLAAFDNQTPNAARTAPARPTRPDGAPIRVLLAEDNAINQQVFKLILEELGVALTIVEDGAQAIDAFRDQPFDLVMMDMQMPVMDGLASTRAIRAIERKRSAGRTPIAMVSANAMPAHIKQAEEAGCDFHLPKPITPMSLSNAISRALSLRAA